VIASVAHADEPGFASLTEQMNRLAGDAETDLDFRAHGNEPNVGREHVGDERVAPVPPVVTDTLAEQTCRNADDNFSAHESYVAGRLAHLDMPGTSHLSIRKTEARAADDDVAVRGATATLVGRGENTRAIDGDEIESREAFSTAIGLVDEANHRIVQSQRPVRLDGPSENLPPA